MAIVKAIRVKTSYVDKKVKTTKPRTWEEYLLKKSALAVKSTPPNSPYLALKKRTRKRSLRKQKQYEKVEKRVEFDSPTSSPEEPITVNNAILIIYERKNKNEKKKMKGCVHGDEKETEVRHSNRLKKKPEWLKHYTD